MRPTCSVCRHESRHAIDRALVAVQAIADDLNAEKVPTAHGGARWYPKVINDILHRSAALDGVPV